MKKSTDHILTTHTGSLPRPPEMLATMRAIELGGEGGDVLELFGQALAIELPHLGE